MQINIVGLRTVRLERPFIYHSLYPCTRRSTSLTEYKYRIPLVISSDQKRTIYTLSSRGCGNSNVLAHPFPLLESRKKSTIFSASVCSNTSHRKRKRKIGLSECVITDTASSSYSNLSCLYVATSSITCCGDTSN